jgi:Domain of unknown function (DUF4328)
MPASYIPLRGCVLVATVALGLMAVLCAAPIGFGLAELRIADRILAVEPVSDAELMAIDDRNAVMRWVSLAIWIIAAIAFIRWLHPAYYNVGVVAAAERRYEHGWAIGGWFVPILNLWRPKQVINDVWRAGGRDAQDAQPGWLLLSWWALWTVAGVVLRIAGRSYGAPRRPRSGGRAR